MAINSKSENQMSNLIGELKQSKKRVAIYGASDSGENYANILHSAGIPILCFIDDDAKKQNGELCGEKIVSRGQYIESGGRESDDVILIASYSPSVILNNLRKEEPELLEKTRWSDFYLWENGLDYRKYYNANKESIEMAYSLLSDEKSKKVFQNMLNYKISRDRELIEEVRDDVREQYFTREIMKFADDEVFLDLGAYTGDTVTSFVKKVHGKYERIIALEPDESNFKALQENTMDLPNIEYHQAGISDRDGTARFNAKAIYTSCFDEQGEQEAAIRTVDSILNGGRLTFLKADIEGMEMKMLRGAQGTIQAHKPKLAIAAYHKKEDIFDICLLLHRYREDYRFYMRHYTEMPIDTVLYAI